MNTRTVNGIATVVIGGKDYVSVHERIRILHSLSKEFDILESEPRQYGDRWVWRVVVKIDGHQYIGSAEVHTNAKPGSADATDCWAVAETSAIGRAIAFCGLGTVEGICSYEEITRGQPVSATMVVEAAKPDLPDATGRSNAEKPRHSIQSVKSAMNDTRARLNTIWRQGKEKLGWSDKTDMALYVAYILDREITADTLTDISIEEITRIAKHLANEPAPAGKEEAAA